ncbi:MAG TPA: acetyl-CoA carboxylase biotin carboxyl carrier protein [Candidatus Marinimicrobia bacterium]|nr:acetyl-CoA carboxylase biotin carboxyl carrier protein [Candidatus Neomarinimicrobiota bacterium]
MSEAWIRRLVRLVEESDISELEYSAWGRKIRISKSASSATLAPAAAVKGDKADLGALEQKTETIAVAGVLIKSPIVGTFYRSPAPGEPPFVKVGDEIKAGQTLCIIEAMKIMNAIEAEISGVVKEILVENGQPVEFDSPLFRVE